MEHAGWPGTFLGLSGLVWAMLIIAQVTNTERATVSWRIRRAVVFLSISIVHEFSHEMGTRKMKTSPNASRKGKSLARASG